MELYFKPDITNSISSLVKVLLVGIEPVVFNIISLLSYNMLKYRKQSFLGETICLD